MPGLRILVNEHDHKTGNADAKVTLVEYGDYQCPFCGFAHPLLKRLLKEYGHQMLFVFRNFPLKRSHPAAMISAQAAEAAAIQDKFWSMHDMLYENQSRLSTNNLLNFAKTLGLNMEVFSQDFKSIGVRLRIDKDFEGGVRSGVNGTPAFYVNGTKINSYDRTYESLVNAVTAHSVSN